MIKARSNEPGFHFLQFASACLLVLKTKAAAKVQVAPFKG